MIELEFCTGKGIMEAAKGKAYEDFRETLEAERVRLKQIGWDNPNFSYGYKEQEVKVLDYAYAELSAECENLEQLRPLLNAQMLGKYPHEWGHDLWVSFRGRQIYIPPHLQRGYFLSSSSAVFSRFETVFHGYIIPWQMNNYCGDVRVDFSALDFCRLPATEEVVAEGRLAILKEVQEKILENRRIVGIAQDIQRGNYASAESFFKEYLGQVFLKGSKFLDWDQSGSSMLKLLPKYKPGPYERVFKLFT